MEIKEAVALIKQEVNMRVVDRNVREAIDTVVKELEKPLPTENTYTAKDMEEFAEWIKINCWTYYPNSKIWKRDGFTFNKAITAQLREQWEIKAE